MKDTNKYFFTTFDLLSFLLTNWLVYVQKFVLTYNCLKMSSNIVSKLKSFYVANRSPVLTMVGVFGGLLTGLAFKAIFYSNSPVDAHLLRYCSLPGQLYLRLLFLLIVPLLVCSLSLSLLGKNEEEEQEELSKNNSTEEKNDLSENLDAKKLLLYTLAFFVALSMICAVAGVSIMMIFQPGVLVSSSIIPSNDSSTNFSAQADSIATKQKQILRSAERADSLYNLVCNIFPDNLLTFLFLTSYTKTEVQWPESNLSSLLSDPNFTPSLKTSTSTNFKPNMVGICVVSFMLGLLLKSMGPTRSSTIRKFLFELDQLVAEAFKHLLALMPLGMFVWIFAEALKMRSVGGVAVQLVTFYGLLTVGLASIWLILYPVVIYLFTRGNVFKLYKHLLPAILVAFGSCSSAVSLPMTMQCMGEQGAKLKKSIAQTVLPLGVTIHMNGPAMYYVMVALFVAQVKGVPVDAFTLGILLIFNLAMTMGFPGAPMGGGIIVNHLAYASVLGVDGATEVLAFVMPFEWFWERVRTMTNIVGDCVAAVAVEAVMKPPSTLKSGAQKEIQNKESSC